jgi:hypothetical protein
MPISEDILCDRLTFNGFAAVQRNLMPKETEAAYGLLTERDPPDFSCVRGDDTAAFLEAIRYIKDVETLDGLLLIWKSYVEYLHERPGRLTLSPMAGAMKLVRDYLEEPFLFGGEFYIRNQICRKELRTRVFRPARMDKFFTPEIITTVMARFPNWTLLPRKQWHQGSVSNVYRRIGAINGQPTYIDLPNPVDPTPVELPRRRRFDLD